MPDRMEAEEYGQLMHVAILISFALPEVCKHALGGQPNLNSAFGLDATAVHEHQSLLGTGVSERRSDGCVGYHAHRHHAPGSSQHPAACSGLCCATQGQACCQSCHQDSGTATTVCAVTIGFSACGLAYPLLLHLGSPSCLCTVTGHFKKAALQDCAHSEL